MRSTLVSFLLNFFAENLDLIVVLIVYSKCVDTRSSVGSRMASLGLTEEQKLSFGFLHFRDVSRGVTACVMV